MKSSAKGSDRIRAGITERIPPMHLPGLRGRVLAVVTDMENGKVVQRVESSNTIVNVGVAAMVLSLLPAAVKIAASGDVSNQFHNRPVNRWMMGAPSGDPTAPAAGNSYLDDTGTPHTTNGAGPWYKVLNDGSDRNYHLGDVAADGTITYETDQDDVDSVVIQISMEPTEGGGTPSGGSVPNKTYKEAGLFIYDANLPANSPHREDYRLFARTTFADLVKTPTRQIDLTWEITGSAA